MKHLKTVSAPLPKQATMVEPSKKCMKKPSKPGCPPPMYGPGA